MTSEPSKLTSELGAHASLTGPPLPSFRGVYFCFCRIRCRTAELVKKVARLNRRRCIISRLLITVLVIYRKPLLLTMVAFFVTDTEKVTQTIKDRESEDKC